MSSPGGGEGRRGEGRQEEGEEGEEGGERWEVDGGEEPPVARARQA